MMTTKHIKAYWHVMIMGAREDQANPIRMWSSVGLGVARMIFLSAIYAAAYKAVDGHTSGLSYENALWSIALYFALIMGLGMRNVFKVIDTEIKSGAVEATLIRPLDWRATKVCALFGRNIIEAFWLSVGFSITLAIVVGMPDVSFMTPSFVAGYLAIMVLAVVASSALFVAVGLTAFWLNDAQPTFRLVDKLMLIFGGAFVPIALLPDTIQEIVRYSPFSMYAASTQLFNPNLAPHMTTTLVSAVIWTVVTVLFCEWVWRRAAARIEVNGG